MPPNPSHLEAVDPVVVGMARAAGTVADGPGAPRFDGARTLPILIHGDAAFPGQGIVAETLNLSRLRGYDTDGTIHIIANNQVGFTATPSESYSTSYASGLARGFKIPIVHVNADDPVACIEAARLAWEYRARFRRDFLIDLVGYRRHGHNEGDEPAFTQPLMYKKVAAHPTVRELFGASLVKQGTIAQAERRRDREEALGGAREDLRIAEARGRLRRADAGAGARRHRRARRRPASPLDAPRRQSTRALQADPEGFTFSKKLERGRERRKAAFANPDERSIDWAIAEELALATILADGIPIRLTGEDVQRGTFSHRHAVYHDADSGKVFVPLQEFAQARAPFEIYNSPLSENGAIGFEFGYNIQEPGRLVIWEAQYGDFINGAQVMLDQFVTSGRAKWGLQPSLVFLLPHGYEGQGPEHSSARPERILQAAANINLRLVNCTTAAQYFHLLRRQAALLQRDPLPLFVLTPKSLLRHPAVASTPRELEQGRFQSVIDDADAADACEERQAPRPLQRQGLRRPDLQRAPGRGRPKSPSAASSSCIRSRTSPCARCSTAIRRCARSSGCRKSRRTWARGSSSGRCSRSCSAAVPAALHRPPAQREPVGRFGRVASAESEDARRAGVRSAAATRLTCRRPVVKEVAQPDRTRRGKRVRHRRSRSSESLSSKRVSRGG